MCVCNWRKHRPVQLVRLPALFETLQRERSRGKGFVGSKSQAVGPGVVAAGVEADVNKTIEPFALKTPSRRDS